MYVLHEKEVLDDLKRLDRAWESSATFALLPDRSGVTNDWVVEAMEQFPTAFHNDHFVLLTSGSTGHPKLVCGARSRSERLASVLHQVQKSGPVKQTIVALPLSYCYAFVNQWLWSRVQGRELIVTKGFKEPDLLGEALLDAQDAMICLTGAQVLLFTRHFNPSVSFPGIIRCHFAGGRFPQDNIDIVRSYFPNAQVFNNYGCAEAMPRLTVRLLEDSNEARNIGRPLPGVMLRTNSAGELLFRSQFRAVAFFADGEMQVPPDDEWIASGDLGEAVANGYWQINGRSNEVFKRFGEKIALSQLLDSVGSSWKGQAEFYREKDSVGEDAHVLVVSPEPSEPEVRAILQVFRKLHPRAHWPLRLESIPAFTFLPNGKIDSRNLAHTESRTIHWRQRA
jgi:acyl-CoA synthetase (AMP-forming)/AMP-acid ligase II